MDWNAWGGSLTRLLGLLLTLILPGKQKVSIIAVISRWEYLGWNISW